jgi:hypothetical protein
VSKKKSAPSKPTPAPPRFAVGATVRVKADTVDPDYPDIPLGGWVGTIREVDATGAQPIYHVVWTDETLKAAPSVYLHRCEEDDLEADSTWLDEAVLEPDSGSPPMIQQPTQLQPRPLDFDDPEDRVRCVFGLTSDDDLPEVNEESMRQFHEYLSKKVRFPFPAIVLPDDVDPDEIKGQDLEPTMVLRLMPWQAEQRQTGLQVEVTWENEKRVLPLADIRPLPMPNARGLDDIDAYTQWFIESLPDEDEATESEGRYARLPQRLALLALLVALLAGLLGGIFTTVEHALLAAKLGAGLLAVVGALLGALIENFNRHLNKEPPGFLAGAGLGLLVGGVAGAVLGPIMLTYLGLIPGAIAGSVLSGLLASMGARRARPGLALLVGAYSGSMAYTLLSAEDWKVVLAGCAHGVLIVGGVVVGGAIVAFVLIFVAARAGMIK